jgi:hypothetical protein
MTVLPTEHESATRTLLERQLLLYPNPSSDPANDGADTITSGRRPPTGARTLPLLTAGIAAAKGRLQAYPAGDRP